MNATSRKPFSKISVKLWHPLIDTLSEKLDAACLQRDAYLSKVLEAELEHLDKEVPLPNSESARAFIAQRLRDLRGNLVPVSLALRPDLVERLNDICERKRIVRDAFFNRLLLLLVAPPVHIDRIFFPDHNDWNWRQEVWSEYRPEPFFENTFNPIGHAIDPIWPIRAGIEIYNQNEELVDHLDPLSGATLRVQKSAAGFIEPALSVYSAYIEPTFSKKTDISGFNCYVPDHRVPGHEAQKREQETLDEWLSDLSISDAL